MTSGVSRGYFEFLADLGMTKHYGSIIATRELVALCHIARGQVVLDVGCGVGATPAILAKEVECQVVGVDLVGKMVVQSRERAKALGASDRIGFAVGDARALPFEDNRFDAVITESVNIFFDDKRQAVTEYGRVTKPGGYVGMTETTWLKTPSPKLEGMFRNLVGAEALDAGGWTELLEGAGLEDVVASSHRLDVPSESKARFERYGCGGITKILLRMLVALFRDRRYREYLKAGTGGLPKGLLDEMGYGVYVGRKGQCA